MRIQSMRGFVLVATWAVMSIAGVAMAKDSDVDAQWRQVISSGPSPARKAGEDSLAYFMRKVEVADSRRRELGLRFWSQHPGDARRYQWLLLTVHMAPHYPRNIEEWARNETQLEPNVAALDRKALARWEKAYPAMRQAYMSAEEVTEQERRFLNFGELRQRILRMREAVARGEKVDAARLMNDIAACLERFPSPLSENDQLEFTFCYKQLIDQLFDQAPTFGLSPAALNDFAARLQAVFAKTEGDLVSFLQRELTAHVATIGQPRPPVTSRWSLLPEYPSTQTSTPAGHLIFAYDLQIMLHKLRGIGLGLWKEDPDPKQRFNWYIRTMDGWLIYPENFVDSLYQFSEYDMSGMPIDADARAEWKTLQPQLRAELLADPARTAHDLQTMQYVEVGADMAELCCGSQPDPAAVNALLRDIHSLCAGADGPNLCSGRVLPVFQHASRLGLSDAELKEFVRPLLGSKDEDLRKLAEGRLRFFELRQAGITLQGPTLSGGNFDIESLRGKIVLIDFWATSCSSCIAAMPRIKEVYDRYKDRGFEVVSVCLNGDEERKKVLRVEEQMGLTWTTLAPDHETGMAIAERFGYRSVPEYMLIDREGKLVAATSEVDMGRNLEALLKDLLAAEGGPRYTTRVPSRALRR